MDTRAKFSADGSAVYLVTAIATGGLVRDRCFLYSIKTGLSSTSSLGADQPLVKIDRSGVLSWPTNAVGFALQMGRVLNGSLIWSNVSQPAEVSGTNFMVTIPLTGDSGMYRLRRP